MSHPSATLASADAPGRGISLPVVALLTTLVVLAVYAATGFSTLDFGRGDNDGMLRLVEVRDLLAGQAWYDLNQYRLGPDGGVLMHWSRLVDAPIAGLIVLTKAVGTGQAGAEAFASVAWPLLLLFAAMLSLLYTVDRISGPRAVLPAAIVAGASAYYIGFFSPASLDHHNAQLTLTLAMLAGLTAGGNRFWPAAGAGTAAAAMLAIGMETAPYVAVGGLSIAILHLMRGARERRTVQGFGIGFGATALVVFIGTVPLAAWLRPACDAFSVAQFAVAALAGFGIAAIASVESLSGRVGVRGLALGLLGTASVVLLVTAFPECLGDPYSMVDPWLKENWLNRISEAQSFADIAKDNPAELVAFYGYGAMAVAILALRIWRHGVRRSEALVLGMLASAFAIALWQVRGSLFLIPMSAIPLAGWIADARAKAIDAPSTRHSLRMAGTWVLSFALTWIALGVAVNVSVAAVKGNEAPPMADDTTNACYTAQDYVVLAREPATRVLSISNLGSATLLFTHHSALAGPYHRNLEGNRAALQALLAAPPEAKAKAHATGATILAWCAGNAEAASLAERAPDSLAARLQAGEVPAWLVPIAPATGDLKLYRIDPAP